MDQRKTGWINVSIYTRERSEHQTFTVVQIVLTGGMDLSAFPPWQRSASKQTIVTRRLRRLVRTTSTLLGRRHVCLAARELFCSGARLLYPIVSVRCLSHVGRIKTVGTQQQACTNNTNLEKKISRSLPMKSIHVCTHL